jgi:cell division protein FtsW
VIRNPSLGSPSGVKSSRSNQDSLKLLLCSSALLAFGIVMVASSSIALTEPYFFKHLFFCFVGLLAAFVIFNLPSVLWSRYYLLAGFFAYLLAVLVFVPGLGHSANGANRWINLGFLKLQVVELGKFFLMFFVAGYLQKYREEIGKNSLHVLILTLVVAVYCLLIIKQPDLGSAAVIFVSCLAVLFVAGMRMKLFVILAIGSILVLIWFIVMEPFRLERLLTFINPWKEPFDAGYQLVQALIAFGRAGWLGLGLGEGVQKLYYLPEAHNDFIFAVIVEELGFVGAISLIALYSCFIWLIFSIAKKSLERGDFFGGYSCFFAGFLFAFQFSINIGVNSGLLPTKGLTLPLISYGGSSLIVSFMILGVLLRASEARDKVIG